jgi:hypothetical protein
MNRYQSHICDLAWKKERDSYSCGSIDSFCILSEWMHVLSLRPLAVLLHNRHGRPLRADQAGRALFLRGCPDDVAQLPAVRASVARRTARTASATSSESRRRRGGGICCSSRRRSSSACECECHTRSGRMPASGAMTCS